LTAVIFFERHVNETFRPARSRHPVFGGQRGGREQGRRNFEPVFML